MASFCAGSGTDLGLKIHLFREQYEHLGGVFFSITWNVDAMFRLKWIIDRQINMASFHEDIGHTDMTLDDDTLDYLESLQQ